ncbi:MAG: hypothetical protein V1672_00145 [Candidatus Diapherotrites archaeon]
MPTPKRRSFLKTQIRKRKIKSQKARGIVKKRPTKPPMPPIRDKSQGGSNVIEGWT